MAVMYGAARDQAFRNITRDDLARARLAQMEASEQIRAALSDAARYGTGAARYYVPAIDLVRGPDGVYRPAEHRP